MSKFKHQHAVDLFVKAVQVDSPSFSESAMVDFIVDYVKEHKWDCEVRRQTINMADLDKDVLARLKKEEQTMSTEQVALIFEGNDKNKAPIFFAAHIDTVEPGKGIKPVFTDDGKITSDGTTILGADDKSGVAPMLAAMELVIREKRKHGKVVLIFTALEEKGLIGARFTPIKDFGVKYGFVFDTMDRVGNLVERVQHGQTFEITVEISDIPGHAKAFLVPNALTVASEIITKLPKGLFDKEDYTFAQVMKLVTSSEPGYGVPNKAVITGTIRSFVAAELKVLRDQVSFILDNFKHENTKVTYTITPKETLGYDQTHTETGRLMMSNAEKVFAEMGLKSSHLRHGLGGHDASIFARNGVPSLVLSCGMQDYHTVREWIYVEDLHNCTELILRLIDKA